MSPYDATFEAYPLALSVPDQPVTGCGTRSRVCVDGKRLARGGERFQFQGVTYGPFAPGEDQDQFPQPDRIRSDFRLMSEAGINAVRTYHPPPARLLEAATESDITILVDIPWSKHLCFFQGSRCQAEARNAVRQTVQRSRNSAVAAYSVGNEIPADIVRWQGVRRTERFLAELADVAKQADPDCLVTYGNFPSTEFLDLSFLDFALFNVYLHDPDVFATYIHRLQNLVGDRPLVLGEIGMDSFRNGEIDQANFLARELRECRLRGLAGAFVFSWTDDWHTGGFAVEDWAFGITNRDRSPKAGFHAVREVFESSAP